MSLISQSHQKYLDDKACLDAWLETGSSTKAVQVLYEQGFKNPATGKPPVDSAIRVAAYRWILRHPNKARKILSDYGAEYTESDDEWGMWLVEKALTHQSWGKSRYELWLRQFDLVEYDQKVKDAIPYI